MRLGIAESDIMQSPSKIARASTSTTTPAVYGLQGWADLPEGLLHSIVPLLGSIIELLAFAGTCRSWRAAFSSYPSKSTVCTLLPPLLVQPHITVHAPNLPSSSDDGHKLGTCQVLDPANMKSSLRCQVPEETSEKLCFAGSSYGQLICGHGRNCLIVDVFTGAKVLSPQLPFTNNTYLYCGMLTTPLASPNSHLLVSARSDQGSQRVLLDWLVGSDSWSKLQLNLNDSVIVQIVEFNDQFIVMDSYHWLSTKPCHRSFMTDRRSLDICNQPGLESIESRNLAANVRPATGATSMAAADGLWPQYNYGGWPSCGRTTEFNINKDLQGIFVGRMIPGKIALSLVQVSELGSNTIELRCGFLPSESAATRPSQVPPPNKISTSPFCDMCSVIFRRCKTSPPTKGRPVKNHMFLILLFVY